MSVIAHCNALVGQAGSVISELDGWLVGQAKSVIVGVLNSGHNALLPPWHDMA